MFKTLFLALVAAALIALPASAKSNAITLKGETGPGFKIEVEKAGRDLRTTRAGTYRIKVEDKSSIHNFHLIGPGLNKKTSVGFTGERTWTIKLKPGRYTYRSDKRKKLRGAFTVTPASS